MIKKDIRDVIRFYDKRKWNWTNVVCFLCWKHMNNKYHNKPNKNA